jgi:hypothetical protein
MMDIMLLALNDTQHLLQMHNIITTCYQGLCATDGGSYKHGHLTNPSSASLLLTPTIMEPIIQKLIPHSIMGKTDFTLEAHIKSLA